MTERVTPSVLRTHDYLQGAVLEFAPAPTATMRHAYETPLLDPTDAIPAPHRLVAQVTHPYTVDQAANTFTISGPRQLIVQAHGERRLRPMLLEPGSTPSTLPAAFMIEDKSGFETPILSGSRYIFNTGRTIKGEAALFADGEAIGLTEPVDLLEAFKGIYETRSASLQTIAGMTVSVSVALGTSRRGLRTRFSPQLVARTLAQQSGLAIPPRLRRDFTHVAYDYRSLVTPPPGGFITATEHIVVDHSTFKDGQPVDTTTDFGVLETHGMPTQVAYQLANEDHRIFPSEVRILSLGWMSGITRYTTQQTRTTTIRSGDGSIERSEHAVGESDAEIRELLGSFIGTIANLRRFKHRAERTAA